ncbi:MAG: AAA family ATPase [Ignavibacteria bacterium]|nr:AAA family ATPase [Ignavibacteria bacterium]
MKIAVTGAHRVGKTTLVDKLQESLPEYVSKAEAYYELEETGFVFSDKPVTEEYLMLLDHSVKQITTSENNVIFDRCPIDILAYIQAVNEFKNYNIQSLYDRVQDAMIEIDLLVFVPVEKPDLAGCAESDLPELRRKVNGILKDWIWDFNLNAIEVAGSPVARRDQVIKYMSMRNEPTH